MSFRFDRRQIPEEDAGAVEAGLRELIARAADAVADAQVKVRRLRLAKPLGPVGDATRVADILCRRASAVLGEEIRPHGVPLYTDARHYAKRASRPFSTAPDQGAS